MIFSFYEYVIERNFIFCCTELQHLEGVVQKTIIYYVKLEIKCLNGSIVNLFLCFKCKQSK